MKVSPKIIIRFEHYTNLEILQELNAELDIIEDQNQINNDLHKAKFRICNDIR
jgi:hypothetical protein